MNSYNWGILGAGAIACEFAKGLKLVAGAVTHSVHSRTHSSALRFAEMFDFRTSHRELEAFLNDPKLEIIYIATPSNLHYEHAIRCLEAGKHVLIEKPFALTGQQARSIANAARQNSRFCMEAMWSRFMPVYREVEKLLQADVIGEVTYFSAQFGESVRYDPDSRLFDLEAGGGCLLDLGVYPLSLAYMLFGDPSEVTGECRKAESGADVHDLITLRYESGAVADLRCSFDCRLPNSVWIGGTKGCIEIPGPIYRPDRYRLRRYSSQETGGGLDAPSYGLRDRLHASPLASGLIQGLGYYVTEPLARYRETKRMKYLSNGYQYEAMEVMNAIACGETQSAIMPIEDSIAVLKVTDLLRQEWGIEYPVTEIKKEKETHV